MKAPHELNRSLSIRISSAVMLALEMKPEDRFQSVSDFRLALQQMVLQNNKVGKTEESKLRSDANKIISRGTLLKSWIFTNIFGAIAIMIIGAIVDPLPLIEVMIRVFIILFIFGLIGTLPHLIYANYIRKKLEFNKFWSKNILSMTIPYAIILGLIILLNNEGFSTLLTALSMITIHFVLGFLVWRYFIFKVNAQR
jgi:hypothetical protein